MNDICIIIPCYNESKRLPIKEFEDFIDKTDNRNIFFLFVNDGSKDKTQHILNELKNNFVEQIEVLKLDKNSGKAEAVRQGMLFALKWKPFEILGFFDADLATPLSEVDYLFNHLKQKDNYSIAIGSRVKIISNNIYRNQTRHYFGRIFATFASLILNLEIYDTQCGAKLIKSKLINLIFDKKFHSKWFFDIEIFFRVRREFGKKETICKIIEVPLNNWIEKGKSKITFIDWIKVPIELLKLFYIYRIKKP